LLSTGDLDTDFLQQGCCRLQITNPYCDLVCLFPGALRIVF